MSLLDKASLIQIPSGYKNGKLYSVKPTPTFGSELVVNGDFTTDSDWTKGSGWSIVNGEAVHTGSGDYIEQGSLIQGTKYRVVIVVTQASGSAFPQIYMGGLTTAMTSPNTYTFDITAQSGDKIKLRGLNDCKVDSISVKQVLVADGDFTFSRSSSGTRVNSAGLIETAQIIGSELVVNGDFATDSNWTKGTGVTISGGKANWINTINNVGVTQSGIMTSGKNYKVVFTVSNYSSGSVRLRYPSITERITSNGTYTYYINATDTNLYIQGETNGDANVNFSIDNVSVKEVIENDVPRLDYSDGATCASLLLEPQRTNILVQSTNFSGGWALDDVTKVSDSTISPDGNTNAITLIGNTNASRHHIRQGAAGSVTASLSVFAKAKELRYLQIATINTTSQYANFDVYDGTIGTVGSAFTDAKIEDYGNGWYRCSVTSTNQYNAMYISLVSSLTSSWLESWTMSNNTDGLYLYGAQLEQGSYPTSYIPTSGSTVTRTADVCNNAGTSATFNSTEGVLFAEIAALANDGTYRMISLSDGTATNRISFFYQNSPINTIAVESAGSGTNLGIYGQSLTITNSNKIAVKYKANDCALWVNGVEVATDTSFAAFSSGTFTKLSFDRGDGLMDFYGKTKQLMVFNEALSDSELATLTTL